MRKHVQRLLGAQRDILSPQAIAAVQSKLNELNAAIAEGANNGKIRIKTEELQFAAKKWLKPYPNAAWRENVEVLLVALAVAMAIRTFFLQPFKIPTGSMQPTLFGVTSAPDFTKINYSGRTTERPAGRVNEQAKLRNAMESRPAGSASRNGLQGISYVHVVAQTDGTIEAISPMTKFLIFNIKQTSGLAACAHTMWFPPDYGERPADTRIALSRGLFPDARLSQGRRRGETGSARATICSWTGSLTISANRSAAKSSFLKRRAFPKKCATAIAFPPTNFTSSGSWRCPANACRSATTGIWSSTASGSTPPRRILKMSMASIPTQPPRESQFSGHVNGAVAQEYDLYPGLAPLFPDEANRFHQCRPIPTWHGRQHLQQP